jgi:hypothetical protein
MLRRPGIRKQQTIIQSCCHIASTSQILNLPSLRAACVVSLLNTRMFFMPSPGFMFTTLSWDSMTVCSFFINLPASFSSPGGRLGVIT